MLTNNISNSFCNNIGYDLVLISSLLAILISKELTVDDQNLLAALLQSIGDNLSILATVGGICEEKNQDNT